MDDTELHAIVAMLVVGTLVVTLAACCSRFLAAAAWIMIQYTLVSVVCIAVWKYLTAEQRAYLATLVTRSTAQVKPQATSLGSTMTMLYQRAIALYR